MRVSFLPLLLVSGLAAGACASVPMGTSAAADGFFSELSALCGESFTGSAIEAPAGDEQYTGREMEMRVELCTDDRIEIPVRVGDDRSRTWVVTRLADGLRLTHIHRRADGTEDDNSRYGGRTLTEGTHWRQDFPADSFSIEMAPGRATQTWTMEIWPGERFDYSLHRAATGLRYRFSFDLSRPVPSQGSSAVGP